MVLNSRPQTEDLFGCSAVPDTTGQPSDVGSRSFGSCGLAYLASLLNALLDWDRGT